MSETELVERLERLERAHRRLKGFALAALVLAAALATIYATQPVPQKITAHEFDLMDDSGRVRAELHIDFGNRPTLTFRDANGFPLVTLAAGDQPSLCLMRAGNEEQILLTISKDYYGLGLYGKTARAGLAVTKGSPALSIFDETGKERAVLDLTAGGPSLDLSDARGYPLTSINTKGVMLYDGQGYRMDLGETELATPTTGATERTSAASIVMFGKDKKLIWRAP